MSPYVPPPSTATGASTPTSVAVGDTYIVAVRTQLLFKYPVKINGTLKVDGVLVAL